MSELPAPKSFGRIFANRVVGPTVSILVTAAVLLGASAASTSSAGSAAELGTPIGAVSTSITAVGIPSVATAPSSTSAPVSAESAITESATVESPVTSTPEPELPAVEPVATSTVETSTEASTVEASTVEASTVEQPTVAAAPSAESLITDRAMYATSNVNIRDNAGTEGTTVIGGLISRQQITAGATVDGWVPVHAGDLYGWVSAEYLAEGTPPAEVAAPTEANSADPEPASSGGANWMEDLVGQVDPNGYATWHFSRNQGDGATNGHDIWIDPNVPSARRFSVMVHEYSHVLQARVYGDLWKSMAAMSAIVGASPKDVSANESTADCMAEMQGATWTYYGCQDVFRPAAAAILSGHKA